MTDRYTPSLWRVKSTPTSSRTFDRGPRHPRWACDRQHCRESSIPNKVTSVSITESGQRRWSRSWSSMVRPPLMAAELFCSRSGSTAEVQVEARHDLVLEATAGVGAHLKRAVVRPLHLLPGVSSFHWVRRRMAALR